MLASHVECVVWADVAVRLGHRRVLVIGAGLPAGESVVEAANGGDVTVTWSSCDPVDQHRGPFPVACVASEHADRTPEARRAALHQAVQHLERGGLLALHPAVVAAFEPMCEEIGLRVVASADSVSPVSVYRRSERTTVHDLLWEARATIGRVGPRPLHEELTGRCPPIVVDVRTHTDRCRFGAIEGAIHVPRTVLEWHLDEANGYRHPAVSAYDDPLVIVCNGGYSSSLAAANLVRIGFSDVRDLVGGMRGWIRDGLPTVEPDHAHLDS